MREKLAEMRDERPEALAAARRRTQAAARAGAETRVRERRTWAFPLYPTPMIDELAEAVRRACGAPAPGVRAS